MEKILEEALVRIFWEAFGRPQDKLVSQGGTGLIRPLKGLIRPLKVLISPLRAL